MSGAVLVTGGAGFIGSHLTRRLLDAGEAVHVLDNLDPQTHGPGAAASRPDGLDPRARFIAGDINDRKALQTALAGVDRVVHLAAVVGVGQSMYQPARYVQENTLGTARLMEALTDRGLRRLVVASSMSVYGEGMYRDAGGAPVDAARDGQRMAAGEWDPVHEDGSALEPMATPERKRPDLASVYALTKYDQERLCLALGGAYKVPTVALRFFNTYGPGQALRNPYTGVLAIFANRLLNGQPPHIYEDGRQLRDFIHVEDVARACHLALQQDEAVGHAINVGTGRPRSVLEVADALASVLGEDIRPEVLGRYRVGDVRHCWADTAQAEAMLGFRAEKDFEAGLRGLADWLAGQRPEDGMPQAQKELQEKGLIV